ncbi:MAG: four-helix bundle copper-binding protein [Gammaproteobacteria bacterium]|nr:four-helix bundle copper-binding protein [Gammaproteobacteria bacterium]
MDRREALTRTGLLALAGSVAAAAKLAAEETHVHGSHHKPLADAAGACVARGQACLDHCLNLLGSGHQDLASCARSVTQMMSLCSALQNLANQDSKYLVKLASVTAEACQDCEDECRKHADKHEACKHCGESCAACYKECKQLAT